PPSQSLQESDAVPVDERNLTEIDAQGAADGQDTLARPTQLVHPWAHDPAGEPERCRAVLLAEELDPEHAATKGKERARPSSRVGPDRSQRDSVVFGGLTEPARRPRHENPWADHD